MTEYNSTLRTLQQRTRPDQDERRESRLIARLRGRPGPRARPTTRGRPEPRARPRTKVRTLTKIKFMAASAKAKIWMHSMIN